MECVLVGKDGFSKTLHLANPGAEIRIPVFQGLDAFIKDQDAPELDLMSVRRFRVKERRVVLLYEEEK